MSYKIVVQMVDKVTKKLTSLRGDLNNLKNHDITIHAKLKADKLKEQLQGLKVPEPINLKANLDYSEIESKLKNIKNKSIDIEANFRDKKLSEKLKSIKDKTLNIYAKLKGDASSKIKAIKDKTVNIYTNLMDNASSKIQSIKGKIVDIKARFLNKEKIEKDLNSLKETALALGATLATLGLPLIRSAQFEKEFLNASKLMDSVTDEKRLKEFVLNFETTMKNDDLAKVLAGVLKTGEKDIDTIERLTKLNANLSVAFEMDVEKVSDQMTVIKNLYSLNIDEVERLAEQLNHTADNTANNVPRIMDTLARIAPNLGAMNFETANITALAGFASEMMGSAEVAGTAINGLITNIQDKLTSKNLKEFFPDMQDGLSGLKTDKMAYILKLIEKIKGLKKDTDKQKFLKNFDSESKKLLNLMIDKYEQLGKNIQVGFDLSSVGGIEKEVENMQKGLIAKFDMAKKKMDTILIKVGDSFINIFKSAIGALDPLLGKIQEFVTNNKGLVTIIGSVVIGIASLLTILILLKGTILLTTFALSGLGGALAVLFSPLALIVGFVALLAFHWTEFKNSFVAGLGSENIEMIVGWFGTLSEWVTTVKNNVFEWLGITSEKSQEVGEKLSLLEHIFTILGFVIGATIRIAIMVFTELFNIIGSIFEWVGKMWNAFTMPKWVTESIDFLGGKLGGLIGNLKEAWSYVSSIFGDDKEAEIKNKVTQFSDMNATITSKQPQFAPVPNGSNNSNVQLDLSIMKSADFEVMPIGQKGINARSNVNIKNKEN